MTFEDAKKRLEELIEDLNALAENAVENDDSDGYLKNITQKEALSEYLEKGLKGDPPVDLEELGYGDVLEMLQSETEHPPDESDEEEPEETDSQNEAAADPAADQPEEVEAAVESEEPQKEQEAADSKGVPEPEVEEPAEDVVDREQIEKLISKALDARDKKDYYAAVMNLERVLELDPHYREAEQLLQEATDMLASQKIAESIKSITDRLRTATDIQILNDAVNEAEALIKEDKGTRDLGDALLEGRSRYDEVRKAQGQGTTAEAFNQYDEVIVSIQAIEEAILKGEETWYDARVDDIRAINDVLGEMRSKLPQLALEVSRRKVNRAEAQMPHHPKTALEYLDEAVKLDGLDPEPREEYEIEYEKLQKIFKKWEQADQSLQLAEKTQDPIERIKLAYKAKSQYSDHVEVETRIKLYGEQAIRHLETRFGRAFKDVDLILASEEEEAIKQVNKKGKGDLAVFKDALDRLDEVKQEVSQVEYQSPELKKLLKAVEEKETLIVEQNKRRGKIQQLYYRINKELQGGNIAAAKSIYTEAPAEYQYDAVISALDRQLDDHWGIDEIIPQVERFLNDHQWELALEKLPDSLKAEGALGGRLNKFRLDAEIGLTKDKIHAAWIREDYLEVNSSIRALSDIIKRGIEKGLIENSLRQEILTEIKFTEKNAEINRRKEFDVSVERKLGELEPKLKKALCFEAFDELVKLEKIESNFVGQLRVRIDELRETLYQQGIKKLQELNKKKNPNFSVAFQVANNLNNRNLILETADRELRLWAVKGYYEQEHILLHESGNWEKIVKNWETAVNEFKYVSDLRTRLREIRMDCLIENVDKALKEMDYAGASSLLLEPSQICVYDEALPFEVDLREDPELRTRNLSAQALKEAQELFDSHQYEVMVERMTNLEEELGRSELRYQREELTDRAVKLLIEKGDSYVNAREEGAEQNLPQGIEQFSRALGLQPGNVLAQQRIKELGTEVITEIEQTIEEFRTYEITLEDVQDQLVKARYNDQKITNLIGVIHLISDKPDRYHNPLKLAGTKVADILADLEKARKILQRYEPDHAEWRSILRRGQWERVSHNVISLKGILKARHPQVQEIETRVETTRQTRNELQDAEEKFRLAFKEDRFDECIQASEALLAVVSHINTEYGTEPFGIVPDNYSIFDVFARSKIEGVDTIVILAETRVKDLRDWTNWHRKIEKKVRSLKKQQITLDELMDNYEAPSCRIIKTCRQHIEEVDQFLVMVNDMPGRPAGEPASKTAQKYKDEVEIWRKESERSQTYAKEEIEEETLALRELLPTMNGDGKEGDLKDNEGLIDQVICDLTEMVNTHRFLVAKPIIQSLEKYYRDENGQVAQYVTHLSSICEVSLE